MWLIIDDIRDQGCDVIARTIEAGKAMLQTGIPWDCLCLDHDMGEAHTGYDLLNWALERDLVPNRVQLVTSNPVGRINMERALVAAGYTKVGVDFRRGPM